MSTSGRPTAPRSVLVAAVTAVTATVTALTLTACASSSEEAPDAAIPSSSTASSTPSSTSPSVDPSTSPTATAASGVTIPVTFDGDTVTPNGRRYDVPLGEDVTLTVTADEPGEIHVHSTPEQELEYDAGTTTVTISGLDQPGIVEVESHSLDKVIVQLQVQ